MTNRSGPPALGSAITSWTREPERAARYHLSARLSDMMHGWLDGRRGIPLLPEIPSDSVPSTADEPAPVSRPTPASELPTVGTPRMEVLSRLAGELMAQEQARLIQDRGELERESARFLAARDASSRELALVEARLQQASNPLTDKQREDRRLAEHDSRARPATLVRARRHDAWQRRLTAAEQQHKSVLARFAEADRQAKLQEDLIRDRIELARADARRHYELALRRIATYAQQLVRTHRHGAELNRLLLSHPVGPELPGWIRDPTASVPGAAQSAAGPVGHPGPGDEKGGA